MFISNVAYMERTAPYFARIGSMTFLKKFYLDAIPSLQDNHLPWTVFLPMVDVIR
jgi:hypothetical protein